MSSKKSQLDRFKEAAKDVGADTSDDALDRAMGKLDLTKKPDSESMEEGKKPKK